MCDIDWEEQWRCFAPNFYDGAAHIDLSTYGGNAPKELLLKPGGGFGDLSHPTTRLSLKLMAPLVSGATVVDIGCGSGILTLAALLMGAGRAIGLDIDESALEHAQANARLNKLEKRASFVKQAKRIAPPLVIVMNMIFSEQKQAWASQKALSSPKNAYTATIVTSGILTEQTESYLAWTQTLGWDLIQAETEGEWSGFLFSSSKNPNLKTPSKRKGLEAGRFPAASNKGLHHQGPSFLILSLPPLNLPPCAHKE